MSPGGESNDLFAAIIDVAVARLRSDGETGVAAKYDLREIVRLAAMALDESGSVDDIIAGWGRQ